MIQNKLIQKLYDDLNSFVKSIFVSGRLAQKTAVAFAGALVEYHPFVGISPATGVRQNRNFHLTGMIIENMTIKPNSPTTVSIELSCKDPDSYHNKLFDEEAAVLAADAMERELELILKENGF